MSLPDSTAAAALDSNIINPVWFIYLDLLPEPTRANSSGWDINLADTGQPDLDGEYTGVDPGLLTVSGIQVRPGGNAPVTIRLSGIRGLDDDDRAILADPANWQGRLVRMWRMVRNAALEQQGAIQHIYTGYMMSVSHIGDPSSVAIEVLCESYLAAFAQASNRTLLESELFDEQDLSSRAALAIANGNSSSPLISSVRAPTPGQQRNSNRSIMI